MLNENEGLEEHILVHVLDKSFLCFYSLSIEQYSPVPPKKGKRKGNHPSKWEEKDTLKWGCVVGGVPNLNYWAMPSPTSLFREIKQFSNVCASHTVLSSSWEFLYHYRFNYKVWYCTQSTSTSIKMDFALYGFLFYFLEIKTVYLGSY